MISKASRILVVRLDSIGDVVLSTPFFRELRQNAPNAEIWLVTSPLSHELVELCPYIDNTIAYNWSAAGHKVNNAQQLHAQNFAKQNLQHHSFDLALLSRWDVDLYGASALIKHSGAPIRVAYPESATAIKAKMNAGFNKNFTHIIKKATSSMHEVATRTINATSSMHEVATHIIKKATSSMHEVMRNLEFLQNLGCTTTSDHLELWLSDEDRKIATQVLNPSNNTYVALGIGAAEKKRLWPLDRFIKLSQWLINRGHIPVVIGDKSDAKMLCSAAHKFPKETINPSGQLSCRGTAALLAHCRLFVGNDSGPMHMAAAAGIPVIQISCHPSTGDCSHYNSPTRFGPWRVPSVVLQPDSVNKNCESACHAATAHCILNVSLESVQSAVNKLLEP